MSGFFGSVMGSMLGNTLSQALPAILGEIMGAGQAGGQAGGGLGGLLAQLEKAGLGEHAASWVGSGQNMPVSPQQLSNVFSPDQIQSWAQKAGVDPNQMMEALSHALPHAVDHATPDGTVPAAGAPAPDLSAIVGKLLGR